MSQKIKVSEDLSLPIDAVTQTFLIVGKRGSGKSNSAARLVEQFIGARLPVVVLDVTDTWWGLKAGRDGGRGLDVYVFGGRKADLPLEAGGGALIAEVLCEHRLSMVLSVKHLSGRERSAFMVAFAQTLFQKWGGGPLHVVLEEAHELAPQMTGGRSGATDGEAAMLGAFKRLWKLGRASGIGGTAVTQRPASLSKDITTQSEILIAHRTIGPQDVKAIGEWVKYHGEHLDILGELPSLSTGRAIVWAPEFPEGQPLGLVRTNVLLRETYDSASTPKVGEKRVEPKELAPVDLERLRVKMSATIEKAKADDPRELRKQIAEKDRRIKDLEKVTSGFATSNEKAKPEVKTVEKFVLKDGQLQRAEKLVEKAIAAIAGFHDRLDATVQAAEVKTDKPLTDLRAIVDGITAAIAQTRASYAPEKTTPTTTAQRRPSPVSPQERQPVQKVERAASLVSPSSNGGDPLPSGERRMLTAMAQYPKGADRTQLSILTGFKRSTRDRYIQFLQAKGLTEVNGNRVLATEAGVHALGDFEPLPTGAALRNYWLGKLPGGEAAILKVLVDDHPNAVDRERITEATGFARSTRDRYLQFLQSRKLVVTDRGTARASGELFD